MATDINGHTVLAGGSGGSNGRKSSPQQSDSCPTMFLHCLNGNAKYRNSKLRSKRGTASVSQIDSLSRILFPGSFILINVSYWALFLYYL